MYLLGNPVLWWGNLVAAAVFLLVKTVYAVHQQRSLHTPRPVTSTTCKYHSAHWHTKVDVNKMLFNVHKFKYIHIRKTLR